MMREERQLCTLYMCECVEREREDREERVNKRYVYVLVVVQGTIK